MTKNLTIRTNAARLILPFIAMLIFAVPARAENVTGLDRFRLWNDCQPMRLVVESLPEDAADIGLTKDAITVAVRSRLRAARLYTAEMGPYHYLYINVNVFSSAFNISVEYKKRVTDSASGASTVATTWNTSGTGTHGRDSGFILSSISQYVDEFIDEYLRVNEDACKR